MASTFIFPVILFAVLFTSFLSGILGMAGGMILMGVLVWLLPVGTAMILHAIAQFFANSTRAFLHRKHIYKKGVLYYAAGLLVSFSLFCLITFVPDKKIVFLLLGLLPFLTLPLRKIAFNFLKPSHAFLCGMLSTGFHLTAGAAGGIVDVFFQKTSMNRFANIATKASTQCLSHIAKFNYFMFLVPLQTGNGLMGEKPPLWLCLAVIPLAFLGTRLSTHVLHRITDKHFYSATKWVIYVIGAVYLFQATRLFIT